MVALTPVPVLRAPTDVRSSASAALLPDAILNWIDTSLLP